MISFIQTIFPKHCKRGQRKGFTLIELLVVIAIISILATILIPSLTEARKLAQRVNCQSNLKGIGLGFHYYANEQQGIVPWCANSAWTMVIWQYEIAPYVDATDDDAPVFECPGMGEDRLSRPWYAQGALHGNYLEYGMSINISRPAGGAGPEVTAKIHEVADQVLVGDGARYRHDGTINWFLSLLEPSQTVYPLGNRHQEGANVLYGAGNVAWCHEDKFTQLKW